MPAPRKLKKSESLEIRIPHPTKEAFMARCREDGVSASEALRAFIDGRLAEAEPRRPRWTGRRLAAGALIAAAVGAVALPTLAHPSVHAPPIDGRTAFARADTNHDGVLSLDEYLRAAAHR